MKKLVAMCVGAVLVSLVGCGGTYEEPVAQEPTQPTDSQVPELSNPGDATLLVDFYGPTEPVEGAAPPEEGAVSQLECGKTYYEATNTCRSACYRVSTCSDGRPMYKCNSVTHEVWYNNVLWWREYAYWRKSTADSWWCANSEPSNCPAFCN